MDCALNINLRVFTVGLALFLHYKQKGSDDNADNNQHKQRQNNHPAFLVAPGIVTHLIFTIAAPARFTHRSLQKVKLCLDLAGCCGVWTVFWLVKH